MNLNGEFQIDTEEDIVPINNSEVEILQENKTISPEEVFEEVVPGEIPELKEDFNAIASLESAFIDLKYVFDDIKQCGGMMQSIAIEADKCLPGFINPNKPLGYYTKTPTATNLKYALEEISKKKASILTAIIAAALALLYKLYSWFKNKNTGSNLGGKNGSDIKEEADTLKEKNENIYNGIKELNGTSIRADDVVNSIIGNESSNSYKLIRHVDGVTYDLLNGNSVLLKKIHDFFSSNQGARGISIYISNLLSAIESIEQSAIKMNSSDKISDYTDALDKYKKFSNGSHPSLSSNMHGLKFNGRVMSLEEIHSEFKNTYNSLREKDHKFNSITEAAKNLKHLVDDKTIKEFSDTYDTYMQNLLVFQDKLKKLYDIIETNSVTVKDETGTDVTKMYSSDEHRMQLHAAVKVFTKSNSDLGSLLDMFYTIIIKKPVSIAKLFIASANEIKKHAKESLSKGKTESDLEEFLDVMDKYFPSDASGWFKF